MLRKFIVFFLPIISNFIIAINSSSTYNVVYIFTIFSYFFGLIFINSKKELFYSIASYFIIAIFINFFENNNLIDFLFLLKIFFLISIIIGYYIKGKKYIFLLFPFIFILFMQFGYEEYVSVIKGRNSIIKKQLPNIKLYDSDLHRFNFSQKDVVYVLEFWSSSCGVCIKSFPDYEKKHFKYNNNPKVKLYSVNIPIRKETIYKNITLVENKFNYKFNKLFAKDFSPCDSLGFNKFPTLIIIKNGIIHYKGYLNLDKNIKTHNIDTEIQRVLKIN